MAEFQEAEPLGQGVRGRNVPDACPMIDLADVQAAAGRIAGRVVRTPSLSCDAVSRACGADVTLKLDKSLLKPVAQMDGGKGTVMRARALGPSVFFTPWAYVDHLIVPEGASIGASRAADMSEAYYVIAGNGTVTVDGETAASKTGDAIPVDLGQQKSFVAGSQPLE